MHSRWKCTTCSCTRSRCPLRTDALNWIPTSPPIGPTARSCMFGYAHTQCAHLYIQCACACACVCLCIVRSLRTDALNWVPSSQCIGPTTRSCLSHTVCTSLHTVCLCLCVCVLVYCALIANRCIKLSPIEPTYWTNHAQLSVTHSVRAFDPHIYTCICMCLHVRVRGNVHVLNNVNNVTSTLHSCQTHYPHWS